MVSRVPKHLHGQLAQRLMQPGVQEQEQALRAERQLQLETQRRDHRERAMQPPPSKQSYKGRAESTMRAKGGRDE